MIKNNLLWEKYRPTSLKQMILLPRIENLIKDGIQMNMIFYGHSGTGKTTLAKILSKDINTLKLNGSKDKTIDVLRVDIEDFCKTLSFGESGNGMKLVYMDEFDKTTSGFQLGLKSFIETYSHSTRFIFTTNNIDELIPELRSRFNEVCFDPINNEEREFLHMRQVNYLRAIAKREGLDFYDDKEPFIKMVNRNFPDLRRSVQLLQEIIITKDLNIINTNFTSDKEKLYEFMLDGNTNPLLNFDYVMENYILTFEDAFQFLGRDFILFLKEKNNDLIINKGAHILDVQRKYNETLKVTIDPIIHLTKYIIDLKEIIKK